MNKLAFALPGLLLWGRSVSAQPAPPPPPPAPAAVQPSTGTRAEPAAADAKERAGAAKRPQVRTYSTVTVLDDPAKAPPLPTVRRDPPPREPANAAEPRPRAAERPEPVPGPVRDDKPAPSEIARERAALRELRDQLRSERRELPARPEPARPDARPGPRPTAGRGEPDEPRAPAPIRERLLERSLRREQRLERQRLQKE